MTRYDIQVKDNKVAKLLNMHKQRLKMQFRLTLVDYILCIIYIHFMQQERKEGGGGRVIERGKRE
jgi:hypothetical protein